jgi:hypothetical protein
MRTQNRDGWERCEDCEGVESIAPTDDVPRNEEVCHCDDTTED